jgi:hypothetical protein
MGLWQWKNYLLSFPSISRSPKSEVGHIMYVNLKARWFWTPSWTRSQTLGLQIGLDLHLVVRVSLDLQFLHDVTHVLYDPLLDS